MKKLHIYFYLVAFILLASCSSNNNNEILSFTTDGTLGISRVNLKTIYKKIPVDKILKEKKDISEDQKLILQLVAKPQESGIDEDKPLYVLVDKAPTSNTPEFRIFFSINDKKKFQESMSKLTKKKVTINDKDFILVDNSLVGNINKDRAVILQKENNSYEQDIYSKSALTTTVTEKELLDFWKRKGTSSKSIKEQVNKSLTSEKDLGAWINLGAVASFASQGYIETLAVNKLIKDSGYGLDFSFDKGSVTMDSKSFFNDEMKKVVSKYYNGKKVNYNLVKNIDLDNTKSFTIGFFSFDLINYLIKEAGMEAMINNYLQYSGKTVQDLTSIFNGDFAFAEMNKNPADSLNYYSNNTALVLGFNKKNVDGLQTLLKGPIFEGKKYIIQDNNILFSDDNNALYQFKNNKAAKNSKLNKKSDVSSYSWTNGDDINKSSNSNVAKVVDMTSESTVEKGDFVTATKISVDKKDENALYYFILSND